MPTVLPTTPHGAATRRKSPEAPVVCDAVRLVAGSRVIVERVDLVCGPGTSHAVTGPSGSGKTTLLHAICGLRRPAGGSVSVLGRDVWAASKKDRAGLRLQSIGLVLQFPELIPELSVAENVALPLLLQRVKGSRARALAALDLVGLDDLADSSPARLSGGEAQRVAIARAIVTGPAVIIADEPTGSVDAATAALITDLLISLARDNDTALIIATHDRSVAERLDVIHRLDDAEFLAGDPASSKPTSTAGQ